ncbi:hypothetical protein [Catenulispora rubra]|uniref:hypothetical protein n=1 Tax=Catenulispora rubra TaxID=280293 RepID=UPI0018926200|nr:hypothetical protein [Catenulispora rubra]
MAKKAAAGAVGPRSRAARAAAVSSTSGATTDKAEAATTDTSDTSTTTDTSDTTKAEAEKPVQSSQKTEQKAEQKDQKAEQKAEEPGHRISVTIPLDSAAVGLAVKAATLPVTAVKKVAQNRNGIPAYIAVGGLAVIGAVEWPVAAVGGLSLAALRRWGPLKPAPESGSKPESKQESKKSA